MTILYYSCFKLPLWTITPIRQGLKISANGLYEIKCRPLLCHNYAAYIIGTLLLMSSFYTYPLALYALLRT